MDVLVDTGVIIDDNWNVVNRLCLSAMGTDRIKAGAKITIRTPEGRE
jgi:hypothetical protein